MPKILRVWKADSSEWLRQKLRSEMNTVMLEQLILFVLTRLPLCLPPNPSLTDLPTHPLPFFRLRTRPQRERKRTNPHNGRIGFTENSFVVTLLGSPNDAESSSKLFANEHVEGKTAGNNIRPITSRMQ